MGSKTGIVIAAMILCGGGAPVRADPGDLTNAWARWHLELDGGVASTSGVAGGRPSQGRALALGVGVRHDRHHTSPGIWWRPIPMYIAMRGSLYSALL